MKSMFRVFLLMAGFLTLASGAALAQTTTTPAGAIKGTVTNSTGKALAGAKVTATSKKFNAHVSAVTGKKGQFALQYLPAGTYTVKVKDLGYKTKVQPVVQVKPGKTTQDQVKLEQAGTSGM